jgi:hypothetical protein
MDDARKLGLAGKDNYQKQAKTMLRRRAAAALARETYQDLVRGYDPDEAEDFAPPPRPVAPPPPRRVEVQSDAPAPVEPEVVTVEDGGAALDIIGKINACETKAQLTALIPEIKALPSEAIAAVRAIYGDKQKGLAS